ncbi:MAG: FAD-binding protein [Gammaproteobacteria bacterium]|nr:FAD-binding protein [Gammaproteobacteria bacterium]MCW5583129.1 FAD-binding protein [Gammaproteobacteria bacterium]
MTNLIQKSVLLFFCFFSIAAWSTTSPSNTTPNESISQADIRSEHFRLALEHFGQAFIKAGQTTAKHNRLLSQDIVKQLAELKNNSSFVPSANEKKVAKSTLNQRVSNSQKYKNLENIPTQDSIFHPRSTQEVQTLVNYAKSNHFQIRTIGSSHSVERAIYDAENTHEIRVILDGDLRKIVSIDPDETKEFAIVTAGAGCYLGVNPMDASSTLENSFNFQVDQAGYALPTLGGISHQSIAGFLQTSSSGGSAKHGVADVIEAIEWVDGNGIIRHAKRGEDEFNAAVVSMGLFGIITHVTFKLPKKYLVDGIETNQELKDSFLAKDSEGHYTKLHDALFTNNEYIHINWLPQKYVDRTMEWTGKAVADTSLPVKPYSHPLSSSTMTHLASIALGVANLIDEYGYSSDFLLKTKAEILKLFCVPGDKQEFREPWYKGLPIDDQADVHGEMRFSFSEIWFPENQIDTVMERLEELFKDNPKAAGNFIVELYCAKQSPYWLSPSYGHHAFRVDLYWWDKNNGDRKKYFGLFWNKLLDIPGARLHWGKYLPVPGEEYGDYSFTSYRLYRNYPKFADWLKLREEMDPQQLFVTEYWRRVLDIPLPQRK